MLKIKDITLGQYAPRKSVVHRLDPRTKVISIFFLLLLILMIRRLIPLFGIALFVLLLFPISELEWSHIWRNFRPFYWLLLLTLILHAFASKGKVLWKFPLFDIYVTEEGLLKGFFYALRITILILLASCLTLTTSPLSLTDAVERFLKPFRRFGIPAHEIAMMLSIALRFIPILMAESERIRKAQISRGGRFDGHLINRLKNIVPLIIPLFLSTFRRANDLAMAMDARCYRGSTGRTSYHQLQFQKVDALAFSTVLLVGIPLFLFR